MTDEQSDYHNITKPVQGKDPWAEDYYEYVDTVDVNLKLSAPLAERPSASEVPKNAWFEATDENLIYRNEEVDDDSFEWEVIGHGGDTSPVPEGYYTSLTVDDAPTEDNDVARLADLSDVETEIELIFRDTFDELPDPENIEDPTVAYVTELDDYLGVFQE